MTPFAILAPNLDATQTKLLRAAITQSRLEWTLPTDALPDPPVRHVLSAGREALNVWHDFGLIKIGANHGDVFRHTSPTTGRSYAVMVLEHPGTMQQLSIEGHRARDDMLRDLRRWREVLEQGAEWQSYWCGGCLKQRDSVRRPAEHWSNELDGVGLCDDHYRRRANYRRKRTVVKIADRGKTEHQIPGQMEMLPGDGTRVRVTKGG